MPLEAADIQARNSKSTACRRQSTPCQSTPCQINFHLLGQVIEFHTVSHRSADLDTFVPRKLPTPHYAQPSCNPSSPAPGPKSVQEPSVSAPEVSETETVNPSPVPSPEEATCGSAPGREVGVGNDKEKAQNEPLSKKKAAEWARIEDLDHNKINSLTQCQ